MNNIETMESATELFVQYGNWQLVRAMDGLNAIQEWQEERTELVPRETMSQLVFGKGA